MDRKERSVLQQRAKGTYKRNEFIRALYKESGNYAEVGRNLKLSRQAIRMIVRHSQ